MKINQGILFGDIIWDKEDLEVDGNTYFTYFENNILNILKEI